MINKGKGREAGCLEDNSKRDYFQISDGKEIA